MARKATRSKARRSTPRAKRRRRAGTPRERIIDAFMALLAEKPFEQIGLAEIAERAGVSLAELRGEFGSHARDPRRAHQGDRPHGARRRRSPTWRRSRRASGCSTC